MPFAPYDRAMLDVRFLCEKVLFVREWRQQTYLETVERLRLATLQCAVMCWLFSDVDKNVEDGRVTHQPSTLRCEWQTCDVRQSTTRRPRSDTTH